MPLDVLETFSFFEKKLLSTIRLRDQKQEYSYFKFRSQDDGCISFYHPKHLGVLALCAYYRQKDRIDIAYSPDCNLRIFPNLIEKLDKTPNGSKFGVIFNDAHHPYSFGINSTALHSIPVIFFKQPNGEKGIFIFDSLGQENLAPYFLENIGTTSVFVLNFPTQVSRFGCRVKSIEDCKTVLTHPEIDEFFVDVMSRKLEKQQDRGYYSLSELPAILHKTTQKKELREMKEKEIVSKQRVTLKKYVEENVCNIVRILGYEKSINEWQKEEEQPMDFNLLLTRKSCKQKEKVSGMLAAIGFDGLIEKMKEVYVGPDGWEEEFNSYLKLLEKNLKIVAISRIPFGLKFNSQEKEEATTPIAGRLPLELSREELAQKSESYQKGWHAFGGRVVGELELQGPRGVIEGAEPSPAEPLAAKTTDRGFTPF